MSLTASVTDFFDAELAPMVRRMADRPRHTDPAEENPDIRTMVWQGLASLGALEPAPLAEQVALAETLGMVLYQGPLLDTLTAMELADLPPGTSAALAIHGDGEPLASDDRATIRAERGFVGFASEVDYLLVGSVTGTRLALVPRDHATVTLRRYEEVGRGELFEARFAGTPVTVWTGDGWPEALARARVRQAGYLVGMAQGALDLAVDYAKQRRQFGQPIGRFQALAFRLAQLSMRIDGLRMLARNTARDGDSGSDIRPAAAQCLAATADLTREVTSAGMQIHGATGMLSDSDAQLFYRRAAVESLLLGSPARLRAEAAPLLATRLAQG